MILSGADLRGTNLTGQNLGDARLEGARFDYACLRGTNFVLANLANASMVNTDLRGARFTNAVLTGTRLNGADISGGANLVGAILDTADFTPAPPEGGAEIACAAEADCPGTLRCGDSGLCVVDPSDWHDDRRAGACVDEATGAKRWGGPGCVRTHIRGANLNGANLVGANMSHADMEGSTLLGVTLLSFAHICAHFGSTCSACPLLWASGMGFGRQMV